MCKVLYLSSSVGSKPDQWVSRWKVFRISSWTGALSHLLYSKRVGNRNPLVDDKGFVVCQSLADAKIVLKYYAKYDRRKGPVSRQPLTLRKVYVNKLVKKGIVEIYRSDFYPFYGHLAMPRTLIECEWYKEMENPTIKQ